jgi:hypothetical protein
MASTGQSPSEWRTVRAGPAATVRIPGEAPPIHGGPEIEPIVLVAVLVWIAAFGAAAAWQAVRVDRIGQLWFVFGAILGPLAFILLRSAPPGHCRACGSPTRGWLKECWWCRQDVRTSTSTSTVAGLSVPLPAIEALLQRGRVTQAHQVRPPDVPDGGSPSAPPGQPSRNETLNRRPATAAIPAATAPANRPSGGPTVRTQTTTSLGGPPAWVAAAKPNATVPTRTRTDGGASGVLATAIYVTGNTNLESGQRYGIAIRDARLQILGPAEIDPSRVALDRPVAGMDARSVGGRLILGNPDGLTLAFMAIAGPATGDLVSIIENASGKRRDR